MHTLMVSVGRNIGDTAMSSRDWGQFLNAVSDVVRTQGETPEFHFGQGEWEGVTEESVHITVYRETLDGTYLYGVRQGLARLAYMYGQDAIALSVTEPVLIHRNEYR